MSNSASIFQVHEERGNCNAKILAHAARCGIPNGYVLMSQGASWYERTRDFLQRICTPVQHDLLNDIVDGTPFAITPREGRCEEPPFTHCLKIIGEVVELTEQVVAAYADGKVTDQEKALIEPQIANVERMLAQVRGDVNARHMKAAR